jgi:hypothetical protein
MRDLKVFVHSRWERDREKVRELRHYVRDLMVVERDMSLRRAVCQWIACVRAGGCTCIPKNDTFREY